MFCLFVCFAAVVVLLLLLLLLPGAVFSIRNYRNIRSPVVENFLLIRERRMAAHSVLHSFPSKSF